jgi:hypothetical protein
MCRRSRPLYRQRRKRLKAAVDGFTDAVAIEAGERHEAVLSYDDRFATLPFNRQEIIEPSNEVSPEPVPKAIPQLSCRPQVGLAQYRRVRLDNLVCS